MTKNSKYLPKELVSLIHNIELNKSGWWNIALQRLIIGSLWLSSSDLTCQQIADFLKSSLHVSIDIHRIKNQVDLLCEQKKLVPISDMEFRLPESTKLDFEEEITKAEEISDYARNQFEKIISKECPELNSAAVWSELNNNLLLPSIKQMGAKFYEFITGERSNFDELILFDEFLERYPATQQNSVQVAVIQFLSKKDSRIRSFVLRQLYTSLVIEANNLREETIQRFSQANKQKLSFKIFVDTNFIFSLFGVHDNPFNEDANTLIKLIQSLSDSVPSKLYVAPITVEETRHAIQNSIDYYNYLRLSPNLANASLKSLNLGGFLRKLSFEVAKSGQTLTAQDFYGPYKTDLVRILREQGIELYNTDMSDYKKNQDVIDDVLAQIEFEEERFGDNAKSYEKAQHDIVLWHFVKDNRPANVESPSDAIFWIVTVDFRFLGFDSYKKRFDGNTTPICLLPTQLIQLFQFWIPRTNQFEEALFESWLWPLLFQELDKEAEQVTVRILNVLSRYENIDDLPEAVISQILFNNALRQRIALESDVNEQVEIVKLALIESHKKTSYELDLTKETTKAQHKQILQLRRELETIDKALAENLGKSTAKNDQIQTLTTELQQIKSENEALNTRLDSIQGSIQQKDNKEKVNKARISFSIRILGYLLLVIIFSCLVALLSRSIFVLPFWQLFIGYFAATMIVWIIVVDKNGQSNQDIENWNLFIQFKKLKKWLFAAIGFVILAILQNAVGDLLWDPIKKLFSN